jgi:hypothetical protein
MKHCCLHQLFNPLVLQSEQRQAIREPAPVLAEIEALLPAKTMTRWHARRRRASPLPWIISFESR